MMVRSHIGLCILLGSSGAHCANGSAPQGGGPGFNSGASGGFASSGGPGTSSGSPGGNPSASPTGNSSGSPTPANSAGSSGSNRGASGASSSGSPHVDGGTSSGGGSGAVPGGSSGSGSGGSSSGSGSGASDGGVPSGSSSGPGSYTCFPAGSGTDFTSDGPLMATSMDNASVQCTIFQPTVLGSSGCLNPVIVWGNGTFNTPSSYTALFNHFATHGFIVAAADTSNSGSGMEMLACLNYILGENTNSSSPLQGHIDTKNIASSGYSQGGAGCLAAGEDPHFTNVLAVSPYIVISLGSYDPSGYAAAQTHPLFMISGGADTVAVPSNNQQPIFDTAPVPIFWATHAASSHLEVLNNGGAYAGPMTAWFRWKLMGDPNAAQWFDQPCELCSASGWMVQTNKLWK